MATREYSFSDFSSVDVGGAFEVDVQRSDSYSVVVEADWLQLQVVKVSKQGETLRIGRQWHPLAWIPTGTRPKATVTMPVLKGLSLHGATRGTVGGFSSSESFRMELSGASAVTGDLIVGDATLKLSGASRAELSGSAADLRMDLSGASRAEGKLAVADAKLGASGASRVELSGSAKDLVVDISGASHTELGDFTVQDANAKLSGASHATVNVAGRLDAHLAGASVLNCTGEPTMGDIRTSGASKLKKIAVFDRE